MHVHNYNVDVGLGKTTKTKKKIPQQKKQIVLLSVRYVSRCEYIRELKRRATTSTGSPKLLLFDAYYSLFVENVKLQMLK